VWDAVGSIAVGVLLGVVAVVLIQLNRNFLVGQVPPPRTTAAVLSMLHEHAEVSSVSYLHIEFVGPARVFVVAAVDLVGDDSEHETASRLARVARAVEENEHVVEAILTLSEPGSRPLKVHSSGAPGLQPSTRA
jgi:divalent metal cation (Fe/Co/Zn/Cd) transporter